MLRRPAIALLPEYIAALERGWSPDNMRGAQAAAEQLNQIARSPEDFITSRDDREAHGAPIQLPDGTTASRLPGFVRWIWDGAFCGSIGLRWQPGSAALPAHVLGHIGFAIVPWRRNAGHATRALGLLLADAKALGLPYVELTADPENFASRRVIEHCGGRLIERFQKIPAYGGAKALRFRIDLET
jgi:predicted acetyltransferase